MATLVSMISGNFTSAGTWGVSDSTSELDSEAGSVSVGTSYTTSSTFIPGAITVQAIGLKVIGSSTGLSGTFTAELYNSTDATITAAVTVNLIDVICVNSVTISDNWVFFGFSPVLLVAGKSYAVRAKLSTGTCSFRVLSTSNLSRILVTTTTASPSSGDKLLISGNLTGAGTGNDVEVTMDNTTNTSFGGIMIGRRGTLRYSTVPGSVYKLVIGGHAMGAAVGLRGIEVCNSGLLEIGSLLSGMPSSATGQLQFLCGKNIAFGLEARIFGRINTYGSPKLPYTRLSATASGTATTLQVASNSGWQIGDTIGIAANRRVANQHEINVITGLIGATGIILASGLTNDHDGGFNAQGDEVGAHIGNLTENVQIFGSGITSCGYITVATRAIMSARNTEFYWLGSAATTKCGINTQALLSAFSCDITSCSIHDFFQTNNAGIIITSNTNAPVTYSNNFLYNIYTPMVIGSTSTIAHVIDGNLFVGTNTGQIALSVNDVGSTITNNVMSGGSYGLAYGEQASYGTCSGNIAYNMSNSGFILNNNAASSATISNCVFFRNIGSGFTFSSISGITEQFIIDSCKAFGNGDVSSTSNFQLSSFLSNCYLKNCVFYAEPDFATYGGICTLSSIGFCELELENCSFASHTGGDIVTSLSGERLTIKMSNCTLGSTTEFLSPLSYSYETIVSSQNHDNVRDAHKTFKVFGNLETDTTRFATTSPSMKMTPNTASYKLTSESMQGNPSVYVGQGRSITATVKVRASLAASGDATTYNGASPRLVNRRNYAMGILTDIVLASGIGTPTSGSFLAISGTTQAVSSTGVLEFYVDCDGTTGFVNVDDWSFYQN